MPLHSDANRPIVRLTEVELELPEIQTTPRRTRMHVRIDSSGGAWIQNLVPIDATTLSELRSQHLAGEIELLEETMVEEDFRAVEMNWIAAHREEISALYPGEWIAVEGPRIVGHSGDLLTLMRLAAEAGHPHPFVTAIPAEATGKLFY